MNSLAKPRVAGAILAALALILPFLVADQRFLAFILGITLIHVLWASGMNLLYGYAGLMPLMFAGIAGVSCYANTALTMRYGWSFWAALPVSVLGAAAVGVLLGLPSLRLRGFYFTLCSLVIQTVLTLAFVFFPEFTNGDTGISQIPPPDLGPFPGQLAGMGYELALALLAVAGVAVAAWIVRSPLGRRLVALREDDTLAETLGINVVRTKLLAFLIGSAFAAVGGAFYGPYVGFVSPRSFDLLISLNIWLMLAFGGRGTIFGPVLGAAILAPVPFLLQDYYMFRDILYGLLIIVVIVMLPRGILGGLKRKAASRTERKLPLAVLQEPTR